MKIDNNDSDENLAMYSKTLQLAISFYNDKKYIEAISNFNKAIELNPDCLDAYYYRGNLFYDSKEYEKAIADFNKVIELNPVLEEPYNNRGTSFHALKNYEKAIADFNKAIELNPQSVQAYNNRGSSFSDLNKYEKAIADYNKVIMLKPDYAQAYNNRGNSFYALKEYEKAVADYNKAIELKPDYMKAYNNRGLSLSALKDYEKSVDDFTKVVELDPEYTDGYLNRGTSFSYLKDNEEAITDYNKAIKLSPDYAQAYNNRGTLFDALKDYAKAIADYNTAIDLKPDYAQAYNNRGASFSALKKYEKAVADYSTAIELDPGYASPFFNRGLTYYELKKHVNAFKDLEQSIDLSPENALSLDFFDQKSNVTQKVYFSFVDKFLNAANDIQLKVQHKLQLPNSFLKVIFKYLQLYWKSDVDNIDTINRLNKFLGLSDNLAIEENIEFYNELFDYLINVLEFLEKSQMIDEDLDSLFYQFTSKQVLNAISSISPDDKLKKNSFELRLYNSNYMNDPKEGEYIFSENKNSDRNENYNYKVIENSNIYLASFSRIKPFDERSLPMWSAYGQNHNGVSLGLNISVHSSNTQNRISKSIPGQVTNENNLTTKHVSTGIYRVFYNNNEPIKELIDRIQKSYKKLKHTGSKEINCYEDIIQGYLDKIRFLYKSAIYSYEEEVRIIKEVTSDEETEYDESNLKLYTKIQSSDDIKIELSEICFGTQFIDYYLWTNRVSKQLDIKNKKRISFKKIEFPYR